MRLSTNGWLCRHVFRKADVVNCYVCGLKLSVRKMVAENVRLLPIAKKTNLPSVKRAAVEIVKSQRSLEVREVAEPTVSDPSG